jgi:hypothetical protein
VSLQRGLTTAGIPSLNLTRSRTCTLGDSVVEFNQVKNVHSYSEAMRGFGWKGWLRVARMYLKMIVLLFLFFTINGIILSIELQLFGVFDDFKL